MSNEREALPEHQPTAPEQTHPHQPGAREINSGYSASRSKPSKAKRQTVSQERRLTELPKTLDIGEQVVGSTHPLEISVPFNIGVHVGSARAGIAFEPSESFNATWTPFELAEAGSLSSDGLGAQLQHPIKVYFAPQRSGEHHGELIFFATWPDGHQETQRVHLVGRARQINELPSRSPEEIARERAGAEQVQQQSHVEAARSADVHEKKVSYPSLAMADLQVATGFAQGAAESLAAAQRTGLETVERQVGAYRPPPRPRSVWWDLAEFALLIGSAGVAEIAGKAIGLGIVNLVLKSATKDDAVVASTAAMIKDGIKGGAKGAISAMSKTKEDSSDGPIAFFEAQRLALNEMQAANRDMVTTREQLLNPRLATDPQLAIGSMNAVANGMKAAKVEATERQKALTAAQWLAYKARLRFGTESVGGHVVTNLDKAREPNVPTNHTFAGLLDLVVDTTTGPARLVSARAAGVGQVIADHLLNVSLADAHLPLRIVMLSPNDAESTIITRDEGGRVRVSGSLQHLAMYTERRTAPINELQAERAARSVCDQLFAKTLNEWGVPIVTAEQRAANRQNLKKDTAKRFGFGPDDDAIASANDSNGDE